MKKRILSVMLVFSAALSLISCGGAQGGTDHADRVTLKVMGKKSDLQKSYMTSIFEQYEKETGNKLEIISYEDAEFETSAEEAFEKGEVPDVFLHFHNTDLNRFHVADNFCYLNDESWVPDLTEASLAYCQDKEGNVLGLPFWESSVSGCYYNKTILDSLGMKPATTQAEFDVLCQVLKETGYTPVCWPANGCSWMFQFGLDPIFADDPALLEKLNKNEITYADIPAVRDMVQWIADAADRGWFGKDYTETGWDQISSVLGSGEAVMTFIWDTWFYTDFEAGGKYSVNDFALMPVFMNTAENGTYEGGNLNMMMLNKNSENLDAAKEFLNFCASADHYNKAFDGISTVNCFKGQTTNIQSQMVSDAEASISANERVSTAATKIIGYSQDDVSAAFGEMFQGNTDVDGCIALMDEYRIEDAKKQGAEGF